MRIINSTPLTLSIVGFFILLFIPKQGASQVKDSFFVAGIHPSASLQSTNRGKQLLCLFPWKGKLYSGYGDYGANTGPIDIYSFSPDSLTFSYESQANTEAVYNFRAINGMLYAPAIDRKSYGIPGDYIKMDSSGIWGNYNFGSNSTHTFDAINLNDSVVLMTGSQESKAVVWKSDNNGRTWKKILSDTAISGVSGDFARFYFAGVFNGNLYVQARDFYGSMHPNSKIYDGTLWSVGLSLFPSLGSLGWRPDVFAGKLVYRSWEPGGSSPLRSFDGINHTWVDSLWVYDCFVDSKYFYALVDSGWGGRNLRRSANLINWENLLSVPANSRSFTILNDKIFIGTIDSKILQYSKPVSSFLTNLQILNSDKFEITTYPNPASTEFHILGNMNLPCYLEFYDVNGNYLMKEKITENNQKINLRGFAKGLYFFTLNSAEHHQTIGKIIIE